METIVSTASACTLEIKEYSRLLRSDPGYAQKAKLVGDATFDLAEFLPQQDLNRLELSKELPRIAFHAPCTLQHGLQFTGCTELLLRNLGFSVTEPPDAHLCCGSAGTYSLLQTQLSSQLRTNKIHALNSSEADIIATANIGSLLHLQSGTETPVEHWIGIVDKSLE